MEIYTHTMSQRKALLEVMLDEEEDQQRRVLPQREASDDLSGKPQLKESQTLSSQTLPPDDEFSWYEED